MQTTKTSKEVYFDIACLIRRGASVSCFVQRSIILHGDKLLSKAINIRLFCFSLALFFVLYLFDIRNYLLPRVVNGQFVLQ